MPFISSARKQYGPQGQKNTKWRRYPFTSHTFTPAGSVGRYGPTLSQLTSSYSSASWINGPGNIAMNDQGVQLWPVPSSGTYRITAAGGKGGGGNGNGGTGAVMRGDFSLQSGQTLRIVVGQRGQDGNHASGSVNGGGGGASSVSIVGGSLLLVAGGGAGITNNSNESNSNRNARTSNYGTDSQTYGLSTYYFSQGSAGPSWDGGGGGSWGSNGGQYSNQRDAYGRNISGSSPIGGSGSTDGTATIPGDGGFGGGGGSGINSGAAGGGGGYFGGNAAYSYGSTYVDGNNGTGGGSYNNGSNQSNSVSNNSTGYVTIQKL